MNPYADRQRAILERLEQASVDRAFVTSPSNIYYLIGYESDPHERFLALLLDVRAGRIDLFVPELDASGAGAANGVSRQITVSDTADPFAIVRRELSSAPLYEVVGLETSRISHDWGERLRVISGGAVYDIEPLLNAMRLRKSADEIERVRRAIRIAEQALERSLSNVKENMAEAELAAEIDYQARKFGSERPAFDTAVLVGVRSALPHGRTSEARLRRGELLLIDMGVRKGGYCSDITRTFLLGEGTEVQLRLHDTVRAANEAAVGAIAAGRPLAAIDRAAREHIAAAGWGNRFTHRVGHGLGIDVHEAPSVHGANSGVIKPGMLLTVEPGVYLPDVGGVRIEDDVWVDENGRPEVMTTFTRDPVRLFD